LKSPRLLGGVSGVSGILKRALGVYRREGLGGVKQRVGYITKRLVNDPGSLSRNNYQRWVRRYDTLTEEVRSAIRGSIAELASNPRISVVMPTWNPKIEWLLEAVNSVRNQIYPHWQLCIADDASSDPRVREALERLAREDGRIKVVFREANGHISAASNSALELATGDWVALLDHDDVLPEHALALVAQAIVSNPGVGLIYSDEDKIDESGQRLNPYFKSDWNLELFRSQNMISHLGVYRRDLVDRVGGFRIGLEGSQDYDLALRCIELLGADQIVHIPRVLYHWRIHAESTAASASVKSYAQEAGLNALREHLRRTGIAGEVELTPFLLYRVHYSVPNPPPRVILIIPTRNGLELIRQCIRSITEKTTYSNYEILIVDNGSDDPGTLEYFRSLAANPLVRILRDDRPFNYSALNNRAVGFATGDFVCLVNNDIEVITPGWLDEMVGIAVQPGVGAVGACLWFPDDTLQHGGVTTGMHGLAAHAHRNLSRGNPGYFGRAVATQVLSAVTAACLLVRKSVYLEVGGLNEEDLSVAFNDVDFCLKLREAGYRNVWTPFAELYHHESATRGVEDTPEKKARFSREVIYMRKRWGALLDEDPFYNPNLTLDRPDCSLAWPPRVGKCYGYG
jgi:O-antigen biosynthesis protein